MFGSTGRSLPETNRCQTVFPQGSSHSWDRIHSESPNHMGWGACTNRQSPCEKVKAGQHVEFTCERTVLLSDPNRLQEITRGSRAQDVI